MFLGRRFPRREEWDVIAGTIAADMRRMERDWFDSVVSNVERTNSSDTPLVNCELKGDAVLAIRAYQLVEAAMAIAARPYIAPADGSEFMDLLCGIVCQDQEDSVEPFYRRYYDPSNDRATTAFRLGADLGRHLVGGEVPVDFVLPISMSAVQLAVGAGLAVASAFGDHRRVKQILRGMRT